MKFSEIQFFKLKSMKGKFVLDEPKAKPKCNITPMHVLFEQKNNNIIRNGKYKNITTKKKN
jgi:hypothetical protein